MREALIAILLGLISPIGYADTPPSGAFCANLPRPGWAAFERHHASTDWFQVYALADGLFAIAEPYQWQEVISYLIVGQDRALLFDSGNGMGDIRAVVDRLTNLPVTVLASHSHIDHVGGHWQFADILAPDTPFTRQRAKGRANAAVREEASPEALCRPLPVGISADTHHIKPFHVVSHVVDGTRIDLGGRVLKVMMIPGHTPDSLALFDPSEGRLFTGDSYYKGPIWLFAAETDHAKYAASIARLAALAPKLTTVHGAHNEPVSDPSELVKVRDAFAAVMRGTAKAKPADGQQITYPFESFSLILRAGHPVWPR